MKYDLSQGASIRRSVVSVSGYSLIEVLSVLAIIGILIALLFPVFHLGNRRGQQTACVSNIRTLHLALASYLNDYDGRYPPDLPAGTFHTPSPGPFWYDVIIPYLGSETFPACPATRPLPWQVPADQLRKVSGYAYNTYLAQWVSTAYAKDSFHKTGVSESSIPSHSGIVVFFDARPGINAMTGPDTLTNLNGFWGLINPNTQRDFKKMPMGAKRHGGGANYIFADGHARWLQPERLTDTNFKVIP